MKTRIAPTAVMLLRAICVAAVAASGGVWAQSSRELYVSTRGDNRSDGSSPSDALRTISEALSLARPGDTVNVAAGVYHEQVVTVRGGEDGREISIRSFNGAAIIDGSALHWTIGTNQNQAMVELRHPYVTVAGLTVQNSKNTGILLDADHLTVQDCRVVSTQLHAISTHTDHQTGRRKSGTMIRDILLQDNIVERASLAGHSQAISLIADGFSISGNTVRNNHREGIDIWLGARHGEVAHNTVYGNYATGIYVDGATYIKIHHNVVYKNRAGIGVSSEDVHYVTRDVSVFDNVVYDNAQGGLFLWDDKWRAGHNGAQNVTLAYNTIIGNKYSIILSGSKNIANIQNNLGYATKANFRNDSVDSSVNERANVWLTGLRGFLSVERKDFRLTEDSPAIDKGKALPAMQDYDGMAWEIENDFAGLSRIYGKSPDAGAFEYHGGDASQKPELRAGRQTAAVRAL